DRRPHAEVRHEVPVHHVHVDSIGPGVLRVGHLLAETREVGGENRGGEFHGDHVLDASKMLRMDASSRALNSASDCWADSPSTSGTRPAAMICRATSNCWVTTSLIPAWLACLMNERILVPKMRFALALSSSPASSGIGFISWTPDFSAARPLSTFKNGTTRFTFHR